MSETAPPARPRRRRFRRWGITLLTLAVVLAVGSFVGTRVMEIPSPVTLAKLESTEPSRQGDLFASRTIAASAQPTSFAAGTPEFPADVPWKGKRISLESFLTTTHSRAFVVLQDGKLVKEWYAPGVGKSTRMSSWSVAKSVISLLIGQSIEDGKLSEDDRLVDLVPELKSGNAYDDITVRNLLDMTAGVSVSENYNVYWPFTGAARMFLTTDMPGFLKDNRNVDYAPGTKGDYRSVNTQLLGTILTKVEGKSISTLVAERLWNPMGAQKSATWNLDTEGGVEKSFCCLNATALDFARVGQLVLDDGKADGKQVVPSEWIKRLATPAQHPVSDWGYSAQWWHPIGGVGVDYSAIGIYGQFIYVNPGTGTVVVKLSDYGTEQDELDTINVMRALAGEPG